MWTLQSIMKSNKVLWTHLPRHWSFKEHLVPSKKMISISSIQFNKSKYLIPIGLYLVFNILNYLFCTGFAYTFPVVDVVTLLDGNNSLVTNHGDEIQVNSESDVLQSVLKDVYLRKEPEYLANFQDYTIIIQPRVKFDAKSIKLQLKEGYYDFTKSSAIFGDLGIETSISKVTSGKGNYFDFGDFVDIRSDRFAREFITGYLYPLYKYSGLPRSIYDIDSLLKPFYMIRAGNLGIMVSTILTGVSIASFVVISNTSKSWLYAIGSIIAITGVSGAVFSFFNLIVSSMIDSGFHHIRGHFSILFYLLQTINFIAVLVIMWFDINEKLQITSNEKVVSTVMSHQVDAMADGSSCYSNSTLDAESTKKKYDMTSSTSLDPHSRKNAMPITNTYSGAIQVPKTANQPRDVPERLIPVGRNYTAPIMPNHRNNETPEIRLDLSPNRREVVSSPKSPLLSDSYSLIGKESAGRASSRFAEEGDIN